MYSAIKHNDNSEVNIVINKHMTLREVFIFLGLIINENLVFKDSSEIMIVNWYVLEHKLNYEHIKNNRNKKFFILINYNINFFSCIYIESETKRNTTINAYYFNPNNDKDISDNTKSQFKDVCNIEILKIKTSFKDKENSGILLIHSLKQYINNEKSVLKEQIS